MQDICAAAKEMFGPAASAVVVVEPQDSRLAIRAQAGLGPGGRKGGIIPRGKLLRGPGRRGEQDGRVGRRLAPPRPLADPSPGEEPFRAVLAAPMRSEGRAFGVVAIYSRQTQEWTAEQFRLADWLAAQCAHILETLRLQSQLRRLYAEQQRSSTPCRR